MIGIPLPVSNIFHSPEYTIDGNFDGIHSQCFTQHLSSRMLPTSKNLWLCPLAVTGFIINQYKGYSLVKASELTKRLMDIEIQGNWLTDMHMHKV